MEFRAQMNTDTMFECYFLNTIDISREKEMFVSVCVGILSDVFGDGATEETRSGGGFLGSYLKGLCAICSSSHHPGTSNRAPLSLSPCDVEHRAIASHGRCQMQDTSYPPPLSLVLATLSAPMSRARGRGVAMAERNVGE